jgi:hypothetical protein
MTTAFDLIFRRTVMHGKGKFIITEYVATDERTGCSARSVL